MSSCLGLMIGQKNQSWLKSLTEKIGQNALMIKEGKRDKRQKIY